MLQRCCWKFSHKETFNKKKLKLKIIWCRFKFIFIHKNDKFTFWATLWGNSVNVRTSSVAHWKACGNNWTFFASSYIETLSRYWSKLAHFREGWVTLSTNFRVKWTSPPNYCWYQKTRVFFLPHTVDWMILSSFVWIGYQRVKNRRTELPWLIQRSALLAMRLHCIKN